MKIGVQPLHHRLAPALGLLLLYDSVSHVRVEKNLFTVSCAGCRDPGELDVRLEGMEPGGVDGELEAESVIISTALSGPWDYHRAQHHSSDNTQGNSFGLVAIYQDQIWFARFVVDEELSTVAQEFHKLQFAVDNAVEMAKLPEKRACGLGIAPMEFQHLGVEQFVKGK